MADKSSQATPTEVAKEHDQPLGGAPPMSGPGQPPPQQQGHSIPPGLQQAPPMIYDPRQVPQSGYDPRQAPPQQFDQPVYPQPGVQQYPYPGQPAPMQPQGYPPPGPQGVPMQQLAQMQQVPQPGQPGQPRPIEAIKSDMQALSDAVRREQAVQAAEPPPGADDAPDTPDAPEPSEGASLEDENLWLGSMDQEMDSAIDKFNNPRRRQRIEKSLEKMDIEQLALHGELRQKVKISAGFVVTYRTTSGAENQGILQELGKLDGSELYLRERLALMNLTAGLHAVGNENMPAHLVDDDFDTDAFQAKLKRVLRYPVQVLADMRVNYFWFDDRVRNIMIAEELGNG